MGPGLNQLEYEAAVARLAELADEYRKVQRITITPNGSNPHRFRAALSSTGRQVRGTLRMISGLL